MRMKRVISIALVFLVAATSSVCAAGKYRSSLLAQMAGAMALDSLCHQLGEGYHYRISFWNGIPVTIGIAGDEVSHIGFALLPPSTRELLPMPVGDFLERYTLELSLPLQHEKSPQVQMMEDGVVFHMGTLGRMISAMSRDTLLETELINVRGRRYCFNWKNSLDSGCVVFPIDWQLLSGRSMMENEDRLPQEVLGAKPLTPLPIPGIEEMTQTDDGLYSTGEGYYYFKNLSSDRYYTLQRTIVLLIDDPRHTKAFTANLFTGAGIDNSLIINVKMRTYGLRSVYFKMTLDQWLSYCLGNGCKPYWGIITEDKDMLEGELILRNEECGYNHVMRLWIPRKSLIEADGEIQARLLPYVPTHGLRYLFEETNL